MTTPLLIRPDWPAPTRIRAASTTRQGGASLAPFDTLNTATHVGDDEQAVFRNRAALTQALKLPNQPVWLEQVHGTVVLDAGSVAAGGGNRVPVADGSFATRPEQVCVVQTADCLPVLMTDAAGSCVAALHAGWRGLAAGILRQGIAALPAPPETLLAWLGPAIGPDAFEVGAEVRDAMLSHWPQTEGAFIAGQPGKYMMDIYTAARAQLESLGVSRIYGGGYCTYTEADRFFSYRRDRTTGRMASLIWIASDSDAY